MQLFLTDDDFEKFRNLIYNESGIHFSSSNRSILESRLKERLKKSQESDLKTYYQRLLKDEEEMRTLLDAVTTNLTRFFRNTAHFQTLENYVIPEIISYKRKKRQKNIKIWSAGCSTGEEPYTIGIILQEKLPTDLQFDITGSEISLKSLMIGKEGFYPESRISGVPEYYLKKYFEKKGNGYQVIDEIKKKIKFDYHNLKHDSKLQNIDILFCRNVLIYFDEPAQKAVINRFWHTMGNHSFLFIGHSESLFGMNTNFEFIKTDWACIYGKLLE